jgi:hypothetical protein
LLTQIVTQRIMECERIMLLSEDEVEHAFSPAVVCPGILSHN